MRSTSLVLLVVSSLLSCAREREPAPPPVVVKPSPIEALSAMDQRTPVPLLPMMAHHQKQNMREHLVAVQEIIAALGNDDFAAIEKASARIGYSEQMGQMCTHMGAGAPGFTEQALNFHRTADRIGDAARKRDGKDVVVQLAATLQTCTACHAQWRQEVVDEPTWNRLTATAAPTGHDSPH